MSDPFFRKKSINDLINQSKEKNHKLKRVLGPVDLILLGIGGIIGAGIFVLTGVAAASFAGPAVVLSFLVAGIACVFAALCYAEFSSMIPVAGSAYTYTYATLGELFAWIIGWDLILEYAVSSITMSIGWSGYFIAILESLGIYIPQFLCQAPFNLPAAIIVFIITILLVIGIKESKKANHVMVIIKLAVIIFFIAFGAFFIRPENWSPFMPFGLTGVTTGAAMAIFAYFGYDSITTLAEEVKNPKKNMPIGIIVSLVVCTLLYMMVVVVLTGIVPIETVAGNQSFLATPVAYALNYINQGWVAGIISIGVIMGLTSVLLVTLLAQPRIFFAMSRDNLLPKKASTVHPKFKTPYITTIITGLAVAFFAMITPIETATELANIGTLFAAATVSASVLILRKKASKIKRTFKVPLIYLIAPLGVLLSLFLMYSLPVLTWIRFLLWLDIGIIIYYFYSRTHSRLGKKHKIDIEKSTKHFLNFFGIVISFNGLILGILSIFAKVGVTSMKTWEESIFTPDSFLIACGILTAIGIGIFIIGKILKARVKNEAQ